MRTMQNIFGKEASPSRHDSEHWMSVSDLMAGLMMVFLFISISYMLYALVEKDKIKEVAVAYQNTQVAIYDALTDEFSSELDEWKAEIDPVTLEVRFKEPDVLFASGSIELQQRFKNILLDFFPRYLAVLGKYRESIDEVRIEGHTSSEWTSSVSQSEAYFLNMGLSQGRTRSVLEYVSTLVPDESDQGRWVRQHVAAVGYSSSRLISDIQGSEDRAGSRRVSFRVVTNAETQIKKIIEE